MSDFDHFEKIRVEFDGNVAIVELCDPPHNFFTLELVGETADAYEALDNISDCRAIVLAANGKSFSAGANFSVGGLGKSDRYKGHLYDHAVRLFRTQKPVVAAIQGAAVGGGLGLALSADFRVAGPEARFAANFTRLGFHAGFGLTETLPRLVGQQVSAQLFYTGRRVKGKEAVELGLADVFVEKQDEVRSKALELATEIASSAPLAVQSMRATLRQGLADRVKAATDREASEQDWLMKTDDTREGISAYSERRTPEFKSR
jgi:enoyl-CoA hydratase/carnithine racemase